MKKTSILRCSFLLGVGSLVAKFLGAVYRVPLTNLLGSEGLGLYQMVFPFYAVLLDFAGAGVPSAISKMISETGLENRENYAHNLLINSIKLLSIFGLICTILMLSLAYPISILQGNRNAYVGYLFLAPSVFLVSLISCFRGYFQGKMNMTPTAVSQVIEQVFKLIFGLVLVYVLCNNVVLAVGGATFAVTLSELFALIVLYLTYRKNYRSSEKQVYNKSTFKLQAKSILKITLPITLIGIAIPLSHIIDSFMILNILSKYRPDATSLYGLLTGVSMTVINLPVSICYGISTTAIPVVSGSKDETEKNRNIKKTLYLTLLLSVPSAILCYILSPQIVNILFRSLQEVEKTTTINLIRLLSGGVILLSVLQTENAVLIGKGNFYSPLLSMGLGITVKIIVNSILLNVEQLNIFAGAVGLIACYFVASLVNLILIFGKSLKNESKRAYNREYTT